MNSYLLDLFKMEYLPIKDEEWWDGKPNEYSNLKKWRLNFSQKFGGNPDIYAQFNMKGHNGLDFAGLTGTPIVAPCRLWISYIQLDENKGYGNHIFAETESKSVNGDTYKLEMVFGHFDSLVAQSAHWYNPGDILGYMGNTGFSTGTHLHYGIRPIKQINNSTWRQMYYSNGYAGYIDPEPFLPHIVWDLQEILDTNLNNEEAIIEFKNMILQKFKRNMDDGGLYFVKKRDDGIVYKHKIETVLDLTGAICDEFGVENWHSDTINKLPDFQFFGK